MPRPCRAAYAFAAALLATFVAGCGGSGTDAGGNDAASDAGTDAAPPTAFSGFVYEYGTAPTTPIAAATMTVLDATQSMGTTTDSAGTYTLSATPGSTIWVRAEAAGEASQQKALAVPPAGGTLDFALVPDSGIAAVSAALGITLDPARGSLVITFAGAGTTGGGFGATLSVAHDPSFTFGVGGAPMYSDLTVAGGEAILMYPNVVAGPFALTLVVPAGATCVARAGLAEWRMDPDVFTWLDVDCS